MMKSTLAAVSLACALTTGFIAPSFSQETFKEEMREHPRIVKAILELQEAIAYMEKAPHDFGGHKAKAIADSRMAILQLKEAIKYRVKQENKR